MTEASCAMALSGYKAGFAHGTTEAGRLAQARRKFLTCTCATEPSRQAALQQIGMIYDIERA